MEWREAQNYLNETGKLKNFDLINTRYVSQRCGDMYLYPDKCNNAKNYVTDISNRKIQFIEEGKKDGTKLKQEQYEQRKKDEAWRQIYPLNNVDFDYPQYIRNIYNPYSLGIDNTPTIPGFRDNVQKLGNYVTATVEQATPSDDAIAGKSDVNPYNEELKNIKTLYGQFPLPYPTFRKDFPEEQYPTTGVHASSYFMQQGWCPTTITSEIECKARQYRWEANPAKTTLPSGYEVVASENRTGAEIPGSETTESERQAKTEETPAGACFKPRFAYIDNSAKGSMIFKGLVPSMVYDLFQFRPDQLVAPFPSRTLDNSLPCIEDFTGTSADNLSIGVIVVGLLVLIWYLMRRGT